MYNLFLKIKQLGTWRDHQTVSTNFLILCSETFQFLKSFKISRPKKLRFFAEFFLGFLLRITKIIAIFVGNDFFEVYENPEYCFV